MNCGIIDLGCHAANVAADFWHGFSPASKLLIVVGLLSVIGGSLWGAAKALHRIGGWPAVAGAGAILAGLVLAVLPKARPADDFKGEISGHDAEGPFQFGVDRVKPRKKRPTIFDGFRK